MEYIRKKLRYIANIFIPRNKENNRKREVSRYEVYFEHVYKVLSWEDNSLTLAVFLVLNLIFWLIVQWELKFFGMVFFTILLGFLWDTYFEMKECTVYRGQYSEAVDEICNYFYDIVFNLKALRKESPSSFCLGMSLIFLFMSFIARNVSGYILLYFTILAIFYIPLGFKYLPEEYFISVKQMLKSMGTSKEPQPQTSRAHDMDLIQALQLLRNKNKRPKLKDLERTLEETLALMAEERH